jgi:hypothetical protein
MAKDINIHLKTKGGPQAKQQINEVGQSAKKLGTSTEEMGEGAKRGGSKVLGALKKLVGPIGFLAIATAVAAASAKIIKFFDNIKTRTDEAVREVQELRAAYTDLFEALDAFDEKSRKAVTKATNVLLQQTGVTKEIGLPVIDAYTRQFKALVDTGQITQEQYNRGLKETLEYSERHGGAATKDMVAIMSGWGMVTPEKQGEFRRMISAGAQESGLTDEDVIDALGRGMPTIKAMDWTPQQAIESIVTLAAGEVGRKKKSLPATTLQALMQPQLTKVEDYGISEETAQDPRLLIEQLKKKRAEMDQKAFTRMLVDIYGGEAAAGVSKLLTTPKRGISETLRRAAGPAGIEAEKKEEEDRKGTLEARDATTKASIRGTKHDRTEEQKYMEDVREIGEEYQEDVLQIDEPVRQWFREFVSTKVREKEWAAYRKWLDSLSKEERRRIAEEQNGQLWIYWQRMSAKEKWESLVRTRPEDEKTLAPLVQPKQQPKPISSEQAEKPQIQASTDNTIEKQQVDVPVEVATDKQRVDVPVEVATDKQRVNVPVEAVAEKQQVDVPVEAVADKQQVGVPIQPVVIDRHVEQEPTVVNNYHFHYDHSMRYYPRVGDPVIGPRILPGDIV